MEEGKTAPATPMAAIPELGVDIVRVARIREALERHGPRFVTRVLTEPEAAYVR